jgi:putative transposase
MAKTQTLSFPLRLPDSMQAEALRLLDASTSAINQIITDLWPQLDLFAADRSGPAWKQVEIHLPHRSGHGSRQERCEMEQAGRILRAQASRKQVFQTILPLLCDGLIRPDEGTRPAKKDHRLIKEQVRALRAQMQDAGEDADTLMAMTNVIEQACNVYLETGVFPPLYEEMQPVPVLTKGQLTFAGDDGMDKGQTYRARIEVSHVSDVASRKEQKLATLALKLRTPDEEGHWAWGQWSQALPLPGSVFGYLWLGGKPLAPTLREIRSDDGSRVAVLDVILEVPARTVSPLAHEKRVLGWDWGVRSLITVSVLDQPGGDEPYR